MPFQSKSMGYCWFGQTQEERYASCCRYPSSCPGRDNDKGQSKKATHYPIWPTSSKPTLELSVDIIGTYISVFCSNTSTRKIPEDIVRQPCWNRRKKALREAKPSLLTSYSDITDRRNQPDIITRERYLYPKFKSFRLSPYGRRVV